MKTQPQSPLPAYRLITGPDDASFCHRVSELPSAGYVLHASPALTYDPEKKCVIAAQALVVDARQQK